MLPRLMNTNGAQTQFLDIKQTVEDYLSEKVETYNNSNDVDHFKTEGLFSQENIKTLEEKIVVQMNTTIHKPLDEYIEISKRLINHEQVEQYFKNEACEQLYITSNKSNPQLVLKNVPTDKKIVHEYSGNMVFLNIEKLREKKVYYRCEMVNRKEDILFPYDCHCAGLLVCKIRYLRLWDSNKGVMLESGNHIKSTPNYANQLQKSPTECHAIEPKECYRSALEAYLKSEFDECHKLLEVCEKSDECHKLLEVCEKSDLCKIYMLRGQAFYSQSKYTEAINYLTKALEYAKGEKSEGDAEKGTTTIETELETKFCGIDINKQ